MLAAWSTWPLYTKTILQNRALLPSKTRDQGCLRRDLIAYILLLRHLFEIHRLPPVIKGGAGSLASSIGVAEPLAAAILATFFQQESGNKYIRNKPLSDKLLLHILVLCLITGNYTNIQAYRYVCR